MDMVSEPIQARLGYAADPAIEILLPKEMLWQIKVRKIEVAIRELESQIEILNMQRDMLQRQYG